MQETIDEQKKQLKTKQSKIDELQEQIELLQKQLKER